MVECRNQNFYYFTPYESNLFAKIVNYQPDISPEIYDENKLYVHFVQDNTWAKVESHGGVFNVMHCHPMLLVLKKFKGIVLYDFQIQSDDYGGGLPWLSLCCRVDWIKPDAHLHPSSLTSQGICINTILREGAIKEVLVCKYQSYNYGHDNEFTRLVTNEIPGLKERYDPHNLYAYENGVFKSIVVSDFRYHYASEFHPCIIRVKNFYGDINVRIRGLL